MEKQTKKITAKQVALYGCVLGFGIVLGYIEHLIPFSFGIPGMKLGLANLAVVLSLYLFGAGPALLIGVSRILITSFLFGSGYSLLYSMSGGLLSFFIMWLFKKISKFSPAGISVLGGVTHNIGQLTVAFFAVKQGIVFYYVPFLVLSGAITGSLIGILAGILIKRLKNIPSEGK